MKLSHRIVKASRSIQWVMLPFGLICFSFFIFAAFSPELKATLKTPAMIIGTITLVLSLFNIWSKMIEFSPDYKDEE